MVLAKPHVPIGFPKGRARWLLTGALAAAGLAGAARVRERSRRGPLGKLRFNHKYRERIYLSDGTMARLRLVRPMDRYLIAEGILHLSPESRYRRFHSPKPFLTDEELRFLTEVDQFDHFAIGAVKGGLRKNFGLGVARFVRLRDEPDVADVAIAVADRYQRKGLGSVLMNRLIQAAKERGIRTLRAEVLATNVGALRLFSAIAPEVVHKSFGTVMIIEMPVGESISTCR